MTYALLVAAVAAVLALLCSGGSFILLRKTLADLRASQLPKRAKRRDEYAHRAVTYASRMPGTPEERLRHALDAFRLLDEADHGGKAVYAAGEARLAVEAALGELPPAIAAMAREKGVQVTPAPTTYTVLSFPQPAQTSPPKPPAVAPLVPPGGYRAR